MKLLLLLLLWGWGYEEDGAFGESEGGSVVVIGCWIVGEDWEFEREKVAIVEVGDGGRGTAP